MWCSPHKRRSRKYTSRCVFDSLSFPPLSCARSPRLPNSVLWPSVSSARGGAVSLPLSLSPSPSIGHVCVVITHWWPIMATHTDTHTRIPIHTHTHALSHSLARALSLSLCLSHAHKHTHKHTHTHTQALHGQLSHLVADNDDSSKDGDSKDDSTYAMCVCACVYTSFSLYSLSLALCG